MGNIVTSVNTNPTFDYYNYLRPATAEPETKANREVLNSTAKESKEKSQTIFGPNEIIPILYGTFETDFRIFAVTTSSSGQLILGGVAGWGEIDSLSVVLEDESNSSSFSSTCYTGTTIQTADPTLSSNITGYTDTLVTTINTVDYGIAYAVVTVNTGDTSGWPKLKLRGQGAKVYDPRTTLTVTSDNPSLCLANFLSSSIYGPNYTMDWLSVKDAADANDALVGTEKRRLLGLALKASKNIYEWIETLRTYAGCLVVRNSTGWALVPDRPRTVDYAYNGSEHFGIANVKRLSLANKPTVVKIKYTDTSVEPWNEQEAVVQTAGVTAGTESRRESVVSLPGIQRYSQAVREATERLNAATLTDISSSIVLFDKGLQTTAGDRITVTDPVAGFTNQDFRVLKVNESSQGRWALDLRQYDESVYSDSVEAAPTINILSMDSPLNPPAITGLVLSEVLFQTQTGVYRTRIKAVWTDVVYPYLDYYRVDVYNQDSILIQTIQAFDSQAMTAEVAEGDTYTVEVRTVSNIGASSSVVSDNIISIGKYLAPGDVPSISVSENKGTVVVTWGAAADLDIIAYELRYGTTGIAWAAADFIDSVAARRYETTEIPEGTWDILIKAIDSVGNESTNAVSGPVTITVDTGIPPVLTNLNLSEELFQIQDGTYRSRLKISWTASSFSYHSRYHVDVFKGSDLVFSADPIDPSIYTNELSDLTTYTINVYDISGLNKISVALSDTYTAQGKYLAPGNVPSGSLDVYEIGGECRISWDAATDIDIWRYEVRYGVTAVTWENATVINRVDALRLVTKEVPEGTWDILVKAIDSVNNESATAERASVTVTLDANAFLVDRNTYTNPALTAMHTSIIDRVGTKHYVSYDAADTFATLYSGAMSTYTEALAYYNDDLASEWLSEEWDVGTIVSGNWRLEVDDDAIKGSYTTKIELSEDDIIWDTTATGKTRIGKARYARIRFTALAGSVIGITSPITLRLDAVPREEDGTATSSSSAAYTITLENSYTAVKTVSVQPLGSTARQGVVDNIITGVTSSFDVYIFNSDGTQIASDFKWNWKGV